MSGCETLAAVAQALPAQVSFATRCQQAGSGILIWTIFWLGWNFLAPPRLQFDPPMGFVFWHQSRLDTAVQRATTEIAELLRSGDRQRDLCPGSKLADQKRTVDATSNRDPRVLVV